MALYKQDSQREEDHKAQALKSSVSGRSHDGSTRIANGTVSGGSSAAFGAGQKKKEKKKTKRKKVFYYNLKKSRVGVA